MGPTPHLPAPQCCSQISRSQKQWLPAGPSERRQACRIPKEGRLKRAQHGPLSPWRWQPSVCSVAPAGTGLHHPRIASVASPGCPWCPPTTEISTRETQAPEPLLWEMGHWGPGQRVCCYSRGGSGTAQLCALTLVQRSPRTRVPGPLTHPPHSTPQTRQAPSCLRVSTPAVSSTGKFFPPNICTSHSSGHLQV